ncbi:MAG: FliM/FliN family flagellar motor switch protein [Isosphaerales bacterium]
MSGVTNILESDSHDAIEVGSPLNPGVDSEPFAWLPRLVLRQVRLDRRLAQWSRDGRLPLPLRWLEECAGAPVTLEKPEVLWRASGLRRPSLVAQLTAPRVATRLALGIEIPLAHTIVDRLLGFDRPFAESRLQLSPVEWGVWTFLIVRALDSLDANEVWDRPDFPGDPGLVAPGHFTLDRVGPDPFDPAGLGSIVTIRWPVRAGTMAGAVRLWLAESVVQHWLTFSPGPATGHDEAAGRPDTVEPEAGSKRRVTRGELSSAWRALAGRVDMPQGLSRLRVGGILPFAETRLIGSPRSPSGPVDLVLDMDDRNIRCRIPTCPVADSGGRLLRIEAGLLREPRPRDPIALTRNERKPMSQPTTSPNVPAAGVAPLDVPVTLTVELGRVNLSLTQLADLKPGDVVELGRHSRAPVELTSNGRLVARGELVLIDTDLGVRVTNVFL